MAKILIMDDDENFSEVLVELLSTAGHDVTGCGSATEARLLIDSTTFDLLITDILVYQDEKPVPDGGISLIAWLRGAQRAQREQWMQTMPIIAISGAVHRHGMTDILRMSKDLGADITLSKPTSPQVLLDAIDELHAR